MTTLITEPCQIAPGATWNLNLSWSDWLDPGVTLASVTAESLDPTVTITSAATIDSTNAGVNFSISLSSSAILYRVFNAVKLTVTTSAGEIDPRTFKILVYPK